MRLGGHQLEVRVGSLVHQVCDEGRKSATGFINHESELVLEDMEGLVNVVVQGEAVISIRYNIICSSSQ